MVIKWSGKSYRVKVKRLSLYVRKQETFEIKGRNRIIHVTSNRPVLEHKNLTNWKPTYTVVTPQILAPGFEKSMLETLHQSIEAYEKKTSK